jgi:hypothetical protein
MANSNPSEIPPAPPFHVPGPKEAFIASKAAVTGHHALIESETWQRGRDAAVLETVLDIADGVNDQLSAMAAGFAIKGIRKFLVTYQSLAEKPLPAPQAIPMNDNLREQIAMARAAGKLNS